MLLIQALATETLKLSYGLFEKLGSEFFIRLGINLISVFVLVKIIYFQRYKSNENFFIFFIFNLIIFLITFILNTSEMSIGAAFGLFAVFSMLRYRTEGLSTKDMTYLFIVIALGLISALNKGHWLDLVLLNLIILAFAYLLENSLFIKREDSKIIIYENISMIKPLLQKELQADLEERIGVKINRFEVGKVDFLKNQVQIKIYYYEL